MITVEVKKESAKYKKISVLGHAMYDDFGKDIVCAATSSIVITTVNGILSLNKNSIDYMVGKKGLTINVKSDDKEAQILLGNMVSLLKKLEKDYPKNICVK